MSSTPRRIAARGRRSFAVRRAASLLWSHYAGAGDAVCFVRVGTFDEPDHLPPDIHIFTSSKQPWVVLPSGTSAVPEYYDRAAHWPKESLERRDALRAAQGRR